MNRILNVHLLPELADPHDLAGHTSVVVDVLRASTTIVTALANGAEKVIPCLTVEEARQLAAQHPRALLGGERGGKPLPGFDLGNSPAEYSRERVSGKTIVFTTTNGTKAMTRCMGSGRVLVGAIVNRAAICQLMANHPRIDIICAGTNGEFSMDDAFTAGSIADRLTLAAEWELNDAAMTCIGLWQRSSGVPAGDTHITHTLSKSIGGKNLIAIGMEADLKLAAACDRIPIVPELDRGNWEIRIASA